MYARIYKRSLMAEDRDLLIFNLKYVIFAVVKNKLHCMLFFYSYYDSYAAWVVKL